MDIMNSTIMTTTTEQNSCSLAANQIHQSYNLPLRVVSVFVLLTVSFLGASMSVASARFKYLHINPIIINTGKFFGTGVILATGFVHILPDAMGTLTDPCLPASWNVYSAYAGLFAMLAALGMQLIEFLANQQFRSRSLKHAHLVTHHGIKEPIKKEQTYSDGHVNHTTNEDNKQNQVNGPIDYIENIQKTIDKTEEPDNTEEIHHHTELQEKTNHTDIVVVEMQSIQTTPQLTDLCDASGHHHHSAIFQDEAETNKISTYLLELGIALHSVLIGLTLGTTNNQFVALFIALCFHQFFEAVALGAQIANLKTTSFKSAMFMVIFFSLTTPVGIAIGIGIHSGLYNPESVTTLLVTGILDSLAAGILIYVALVNLINAEMGVNAHGFYSLSNRLKFLYYAALYLGVAGMAVIGRWA